MGFDDEYRSLLGNLLKDGSRVRIGRSMSIASEEVTIELLNCALTLADPRDRILAHPLRSLNVFSAVGRFVWMMSGSNRLADIEFYEPRARTFSDDGLTVPGSSEGARLINPRPGLNQIENIIEVLKREVNTRRAAVVTYFPEDAGRVSRDIPCTLALVYNVRDGKLHATTVMRANDALRVLPYDLFLFSMLAEFVAVEVGAEFASYYHSSVSMHIYERDIGEATAIAMMPSPESRRMAPMPETTTWSDILKLVDFEAHVRKNAHEIKTGWQAFVEDAMKIFDPYWRDFALVLILHALRKHVGAGPEFDRAAVRISNDLGPEFGRLVLWGRA
jgi:Thymidylate synthase